MYWSKMLLGTTLKHSYNLHLFLEETIRHVWSFKLKKKHILVGIYLYSEINNARYMILNKIYEQRPPFIFQNQLSGYQLS